MFNNRYLISLAVLSLSLLVAAGCSILGRKRDPLLAANPYQKLAFYGKVVDKATKEPPIFPPKIILEPENPGNILIVDSSIFYIEDKGLDPAFEYTLKVFAQYYSEKDTIIKYIPGQTQFLGTFEIECQDIKSPGFTLKPFIEFTPGTGVLESKGWKISSFVDHWKSTYGDQPFKIEDLEQYIKESLPPGSPPIAKEEVDQTLNQWLKDSLIIKYGRNAYRLK